MTSSCSAAIDTVFFGEYGYLVPNTLVVEPLGRGVIFSFLLARNDFLQRTNCNLVGAECNIAGRVVVRNQQRLCMPVRPQAALLNAAGWRHENWSRHKDTRRKKTVKQGNSRGWSQTTANTLFYHPAHCRKRSMPKTSLGGIGYAAC